MKHSRAIETHRGGGETDAGCEDLCGAINRYLIVPTLTSDELTVWLHQTDELQTETGASASSY